MGVKDVLAEVDRLVKAGKRKENWPAAYKWFVVSSKYGPVSGWEYKEDAADNLDEVREMAEAGEKFAVVSKASLKRTGMV